VPEEENSENAARMRAGEYKTTKGFIRDLAAISSVKENVAMTRNRRLTGELFYPAIFSNQ